MSKPPFNPEDLVGIEPKHVTYVTDQTGSNHDALFVKEVYHTKDGKRYPRLKMVEDYKRPFWVTTEGRRNHNDKKDYEFVANTRKYTSTQIDLGRSVVNVLKDFGRGPNPPIKYLARSPYLYGVDVTSACLIKNDYREQYPDLFSFNTIAGGDIETNVHSKDGEIICMSVTMKERAVLYYLKSWIADIEDPVAKTHEAAEKHIGDTLRKRNVKLDVYVVDSPAKIVMGIVEHLNKWKPDFFTFWNMDFDITNMIRALLDEGIAPKDVFSDPSVPDRYKYFDYRKGQAQKVTASGKTMSINIEDRWSWATHPACWQFIDSLPVYRILRLAAGKDSSYALDYILNKELGISKLKFEATQHLTGLRWHEVMQKDYKIEYGVYNVFDSMTLEMLDEKTNDLASSISLTSKSSEYRNFNSNPKRLCDDMHFWYLDQNPPMVIASSSDQQAEEYDPLVVGHNDWIVTLPSYMAAPNGLECIEELPGYTTGLWAHVAD